MEGVSYAQRCFEDVRDGEQLPPIQDPMTFRRVIMTPAATWDYFPGHHDPEYARTQGQPTIYLNTMHIMGFVDRMITDWAGPATFLTRRQVRLHRPLYAGDTVIGNGEVKAKRGEERDGRRLHLLDLELSVNNQRHERCASAAATVALPSRTADEHRTRWW